MPPVAGTSPLDKPIALAYSPCAAKISNWEARNGPSLFLVHLRTLGQAAIV
jgi:hypothetical protein